MRIKRILSLIITLVMLTSLMFVSDAVSYNDVSESDSYFEAVEALSSLGILKGYGDGAFQPDGKITRAEAAVIIMRISGMGASEDLRTNTVFEDVTASHWASGVINDAYNAGIVNGMTIKYDNSGNVIGGTFKPEDEVTYDQFVKMLVCALGYQKKAEASVANGTNPYPTGYRVVANQKKITEGTTNSTGGAARSTVARLVYNALTVNLMDQTSFGTDQNFSEINNQSILYTKLNAIKVDAKIVNSTLDPTSNKVSLSIIDGGYDSIAVANNKYNYPNSLRYIDKGDVNLSGLQGITVTAIVDISNYGNEKLLAVFPKAGRNNSLEIEPMLFKDVYGTSIRYYKNADSYNLTTSAKVEAPFNIYLNLVNIDEATTTSSIPGTVAKYAVQHGHGGISSNDTLYKFIDTDNNGLYDALFIDNASSFIVGKINSQYKEIYRSNDSGVFNSSLSWNTAGTYSILPLSLDTSNEDVSYDIEDAFGRKLEFEDIDVGDVLTVYMSKDGDYTYYKIIVSTARSITGVIEETYSEKLKDNTNSVTYYKIDGESYRLNGTASSSKLEPGLSGEFLLTADNKIIYFDLDAKVRNFAAAINVAASNSTFDKGVAVQLFTDNGSVGEYKLASTFYLNGTSYAVNDSTVSSVVSTVKSAIAGQIVIYELNSKYEIKKIYYGNNGLKMVDSDYRLMDYTTSTTYKSYSSKLGSAYISDNTKLVAIKNYSKYTDDEQYSLLSKYSLVDEKSYPCYIVTDSAREAEFVLINGFVSSPSNTSQPFIITGIGTTAVDGYPRKLLKGYIGNQSVSYPLADDDEVTFIDMSGKVDGDTFTTYSLSSTYQTYTALKKAKEDADAELSDATAKKATADANLISATTAYNEAESNMKAAEEALKNAQDAYDAANGASNASNIKLNETELALQEAQKAYDIAKEEKTASDAKLAAALKDKNDAEAVYLALEADLKKSESDLKDAEAKLKNAGDSLIAAEKAEQELKDKIKLAEEEKSKVIAKADDLNKILETSSAKITALAANVKSISETAASKLKIKEAADAGLKTAKVDLEKATASLLDSEKALKVLEDSEADAEKITLAKAAVEKANAGFIATQAAANKANDVQKTAEKEYKAAFDAKTKAEKELEAENKMISETKAAISSVKSPKVFEANILEYNKELVNAKANITMANNNYINASEIKTDILNKYEATAQKLYNFNLELDDVYKKYDAALLENAQLNDEFKLNQDTLYATNEKYLFLISSTGDIIDVTSLDEALRVAQADYDSKKTIFDEAKLNLENAKSESDAIEAVYNTAVANQTEAASKFDGAAASSNSASLSVASAININDVLQITLNANEEIISYKHLVKNYDNYVYVMMADGNDEDTDKAVSAKLVCYPLYQSNLPDIITNYDTFNGKVVKSGITMEGFGIGGRLYNVNGRSVEFFNPSSTASTYAQAIEYTKDITYDNNSVAYIVGSTYSKPTVSVLESVKTYRMVEGDKTESAIKDSLNKSDDFVYIYKYDGDTYLTYVIDTKSNNR